MKSIYLDPNWAMLINGIKKATGWSNRQVSAEAKVPSYTILELLRNGDKHVYYKTGIALANLHERVTEGHY